jgi:hypothetical protein
VQKKAYDAMFKKSLPNWFYILNNCNELRGITKTQKKKNVPYKACDWNKPQIIPLTSTSYRHFNFNQQWKF